MRNEGIWENGNFIREAKVNLPNLNNNIANNTDRADIERERQQLAEERRKLEQEKREREQQRQSQRVNLQVTHTLPSSDGSITINVQTNADTASLLINGEEQGGRTSGDYVIKKVARAGQETKFTVIATDINGNKDTKIITVTRQVVESAVKYAQLNPAQVKKQPERDAVAVIIGIAKYESLPVAEFANDDARAFYDYAIRGLGVKPENIKLLVDEGAREAEILKTFRTWLPSRVKSSTEVFVFYSGHGLPTPDGNGLYLLPLQADREVIDDTAIPFAKINDAISMAKPKSVTVILDACYSGQTKAGQTLVASARPLTLKAQNSFFPPNFTVISASQSDQISSSSPDLQHGIFSYYLMKGMEGDADMNKDGKITLGEMRDYLVEQVGRQAAMMSRKQEPQLIGDAGRVLVGR
jgi:type II secretory pathway pseudopilin PulG